MNQAHEQVTHPGTGQGLFRAADGAGPSLRIGSLLQSSGDLAARERELSARLLNEDGEDPAMPCVFGGSGGKGGGPWG